MLFDLDNKWLLFINKQVQQYPWIDQLMIFFAEYVQYAFVLLILFLWLLNKSHFRVIAFQAMLAFTLAYSINRIIELFFFRDRPFITQEIFQLVDHSANSSFPSDHATSAIVIAATVWLSSLRFKNIWLALALAVAFSRIWVGVHYPLDVAAGILNGMLIALLTHHVLFKKAKLITSLISRPVFQGRG
ncbi:phosphatase PAP2 family protein [Fictibacillus aquaticus]|uniref:Undecaprenyl-diphosphatase n=1 Tax=Fictibacillus aquaticus TaxID=2021314 RepID=A0A235FDI7_9BACL|nr:phosphatase PAP2 family protein [Fictibacillus aquaticus]OYD59418.1 undecaprenyl-diphosphatase [Fictibacillus aquaticus]